MGKERLGPSYFFISLVVGPLNSLVLCAHTVTNSAPMMMMMMSFICSCRNKKIGAELHIYLEEGTYHKRLFRGPNTDDMKK